MKAAALFHSKFVGKHEINSNFVYILHTKILGSYANTHITDFPLFGDQIKSSIRTKRFPCVRDFYSVKCFSVISTEF